MLMQAAAQQWKVKLAEVRAEKGFVVGPGGRKLSYGQLAEAAAKQPVPEKVTLKQAKDSSHRQAHAPHRFDGEGHRQGAVRPRREAPDLHTAVVAHPPVFGARVKSFNPDKVKSVPGVTHVVQVSNGVAVVGQNFWAARRAAMRSRWNGISVPMRRSRARRWAASYRETAKTPGTVARKPGNPEALKGAAKTILAEYECPFLAHAPMEPLNCTVEVRADGAEIWVGLAIPDRRPGRGGENARAAALAGAAQHDARGRRFRPSREPGILDLVQLHGPPAH